MTGASTGASSDETMARYFRSDIGLAIAALAYMPSAKPTIGTVPTNASTKIVHISRPFLRAKKNAG